MSLSGGIGVSPELTEAFSHAVDSNHIRFIKISINKDPLKLVPDASVDASGSLLDDLRVQDESNVLQLDENIPAYILVRDEGLTGWLAMYYMPEYKVAPFNRMVYSTTRNTLTKSLGSSLFTGSPEVSTRTGFVSAYNEYIKIKADKSAAPLNAMEREMADIRAAEREAQAGGGGGAFAGMSARQNHLGTMVGLGWGEEVEEAVRELGAGDGSRVVVISIDTASETLILNSVQDIGVEQLGSVLPSSEPSYALFAWPQFSTTPPTRQIIFIYACPSSSPIKHRMLYSSGSRGVFASAKTILGSESSSVLAPKKIETSDPNEINEAFIRAELGVEGGESAPASGAGTPSLRDEEKKPFARPKGPGRRR